MKPHKKPQAISPSRITIRLDRRSDVPLFVQVRDQIRSLIERHHLRDGERLPPVRLLAGHLGVNQITIARAYQELAEQGATEGRRGGGTFIRASMSRMRPLDAERALGAGPLLAERLFELSHAPGVIAFTSNYPIADAGIVDEFRSCIAEAIDHDFASCFHYDPPLGRPAVRFEVARYLAGQGVVVDPEQIVMTSGGQQAIDLTVRSLVSPGSAVVVERPVYYGAINAVRMAHADVLDVPLEEDGMNIDILADRLARNRVSLIYINPTFQNPTGLTTSEPKRRAILDLARRYNVAILEDDHSSEWRYRGQPAPTLISLAEPDDRVFLARSIGKVMLPGQRLGYLVVPPGGRRSILAAKAGADLHCNAILQEAFALFLKRGRYVGLFDRVRQSYGARQELLFEELARTMPEGTHVSVPDGGLSLWITLPEGADVSELYFRAVQRGVAFLSGETFFASNPMTRNMRVSFGLVPEHNLLEGVSRLSAVVRDLLVPQRERGAILT